jgi:hypothetical protein
MVPSPRHMPTLMIFSVTVSVSGVGVGVGVGVGMSLARTGTALLEHASG